MISKLSGLFRLLRFELPLSAGICVVLGQLLALGYFPSIDLILLSFFSVFLISASILVLNDFFDVETDKINAPERPIPSGLVSPGEALFFSIFLLISGLLFSALINLSVFLIAIMLTVIGFLYNRYFKKSGLIGNLMVSFSVGMTFIYGGVTVGMPFNRIVLFFSLIAALIDLGEEIAADAMDMKGDLLINSNSVAIKFGRGKAINLSAVIFSSVIVLSGIPFILKWFTPAYIIPILIMDLSIAYPVIRLIRSKNDKGRKFIRWIYLGSTFGLVVFLVMRVAGVQ